MNETSENTVVITPELLEEARRKVTPELLAWLDALTDDDIDAMIVADPDAAPALDDAFYARATVVRPFKDAAE